ncbi:hypothetical protein GWI33_015536 [Rhynchophorus ferrugineus]|uniref:Uncharacterized protein n=1 Tax=Rhynchophorus ferrugineus TaxID=354439 RepID=A0A834I0M3_RHYFE|nr:hypothetical protein GWI33_015536 [Rhynchophorus ferrugineus]
MSRRRCFASGVDVVCLPHLRTRLGVDDEIESGIDELAAGKLAWGAVGVQAMNPSLRRWHYPTGTCAGICMTAFKARSLHFSESGEEHTYIALQISPVCKMASGTIDWHSRTSSSSTMISSPLPFYLQLRLDVHEQMVAVNSRCSECTRTLQPVTLLHCVDR